MKRIIPFILTAVVLVSCSVKEDRSLAPCWLTVDFTRCSSPVLFRGDAEGWSVRETVDPEATPLVDYDVPKGTLHLSGVLGVSGNGSDMLMTEDAMVIKAGRQCPPVYLAGGTYVTVGKESALAVIEPHKQYCEIFFSMPEGMELVADRFIVQITSSSAGYRLPDHSVFTEEFSYSFRPNSEGRASVRVPRQGNDDLRAILYYDGLAYKTVNLSSELAAAGYDWDAEDLEDVLFMLPVGNASSVILIGDWDPVDFYNKGEE